MLINPSQIDAIFRALADENRRWIVQMLSSGPRSVMELAELLPITPAGVSQHLQILEKSGLVHSEKIGRVDWIVDRRKRLNFRPLGY